MYQARMQHGCDTLNISTDQDVSSSTDFTIIHFDMLADALNGCYFQTDFKKLDRDYGESIFIHSISPIPTHLPYGQCCNGYLS